MMKTRPVLVAAGAAATILMAATPAGAATVLPTSPAVGADISYPQCGGNYGSDLSGEPFGVVGANGGRPMETNACFAAELAWETNLKAPSSLQVYVNTADPGNTVADWPTAGTSPYGPCQGVRHGTTGADSTACAYVYGEQEANYDLGVVGGTNGAGYQWWLDVETANSWQSRKNLEMNQATLNGMLAVLPPGQVGLYSTSYQWGTIIGSNLDSLSQSDGLGTLDEWIPTGSNSQATAAADCGTIPTFTSGHLIYTQFTSGYDYDYTC